MERKTGNNNRIAMWCFTKCFPTVECQKPLTSNADICSKNPERSFRKLQPFWFVHKKMNAAWPDGPWPQLKIEFTCENKGRNTQCDPRLAPVVQSHPLNHQDAAENQTVLYNSFLQNISFPSDDALPSEEVVSQYLNQFTQPAQVKGFYFWIKVPWSRSCAETWDCRRHTHILSKYNWNYFEILKSMHSIRFFWRYLLHSHSSN